jgi:hypothetical protein
MVMRGNELDELEADDAPKLEDCDGKGGPMRCLQIDLRQFGLGACFPPLDMYF